MSVKTVTQSHKITQYVSSVMLGLLLWGGSAKAHIGHDNEFNGGDAAQVTKPIEVEAKIAEAMGLKTEAIVATGDTLKIPAASVVDAGENKLVYVQSGTSYKPVVVKLGAASGEMVAIKEGNLVAGDRVVSKGTTLLYSQALRETPSSAPAAPAPAADTNTAAQSGLPSKKWLLLGIGGVVVVGSSIAVLSIRRRKSQP